jgi:hypothetical protein
MIGAPVNFQLAHGKDAQGHEVHQMAPLGAVRAYLIVQPKFNNVSRALAQFVSLHAQDAACCRCKIVT